MRYFSPVLDIATIKRPLHTILGAERSAHVFQRRNKPRTSKIAMIRRFCCKLCIISLPFKILRHLNALFAKLYLQNVAYTFSTVKTSPETVKSQWFVVFDEITALFLSRLGYFTFNRPFNTILRAERSANVFQRRNKPRNYKIAIIRRLWQKLCVIFPPT